MKKMLLVTMLIAASVSFAFEGSAGMEKRRPVEIHFPGRGHDRDHGRDRDRGHDRDHGRDHGRDHDRDHGRGREHGHGGHRR